MSAKNSSENAAATDAVQNLAALAQGIIPADSRDDGASSVEAGVELAKRIQSGINASLYRQGLELSQTMAQEKYGHNLPALSAGEMHALLGAIRERLPAFFKQLRLDVSALYLSDPRVWARIGFPGPSIDQGGYPDFDQPQRSPGGKPGAKI